MRVMKNTLRAIILALVLTIPAVVVISGLFYLAMVHWFGVPVKAL